MKDPKTIRKWVILLMGKPWETNGFGIPQIVTIFLRNKYIYIDPYFPMIHACSGCLDAQKHCFARTRLRSIHKLMLMLDSEIRWLQDLELYSV